MTRAVLYLSVQFPVEIYSMSDSSLLAPYHLGDMTLANRIALAPMTRARAGEQRQAAHRGLDRDLQGRRQHLPEHR